MLLRERVEAELKRREELARELRELLGGSPWVVEDLRTRQRITNARALNALHDPADTSARYAAARRVLERHQPETVETWAFGGPVPHEEVLCAGEWQYGLGYRVLADDCPEILDLAASLGVGEVVNGGTT